MPFPSNDSTPPDVRARHSGRCLTVWREAWNDTFKRHDNEDRAWATAEMAAIQCEASKMTTAVKFAEGSDSIIEGLAIPFGGPLGGRDLHGEKFGPETDIVPDLYPQGRPIMYHHGLNKDMSLVVQGRQTDYEMTDEGIFAKGELDKSAKYHATVSKLIRSGKLFFSSGAMAHLVKMNDDGLITRWPWMELSLTTSPANPDARVTYAVKAADHLDHLTAAGLEVPTALIKTLIGEVDSESESFAGHAERVTALVDAFAARAVSRSDARTKAGRELSAANRSEIEEVIAAIEALGERKSRLADLLARNGPKDDEAQKAVEVEYFAYLREQARQLGVALS